MTELRPLELELIQSISEKAGWQENTWVSVNSEAVKAKIRFFYLFIKKKSLHCILKSNVLVLDY